MSNYLMQNKDVRQELDLDQYEATAFLKEHGRRWGRILVITRQELRRMQVDGTVAEFKRGLGHEVLADGRSD